MSPSRGENEKYLKPPPSSSREKMLVSREYPFNGGAAWIVMNPIGVQSVKKSPEKEKQIQVCRTKDVNQKNKIHPNKKVNQQNSSHR